MQELSQKIKHAKKILTSCFDGQLDQYKSDLWKDILGKRANLPDADRLVNFLSNNASYGYGNNLEVDSQEKFERFILSLVPEIPMNFLESIKEPDFGNPLRYKYGKKIYYSMVFLQNMATTFQIKQLPLKKNLRILEIGAGFGAVAYQLHQILDIKKYTIIDIPESLYLSYFYLSENTGKDAQFAIEKKIERGFEFVLPNQLDLIDPGFDLIINTISLGEMTLPMVETYKKLISTHLNETGYFFSINTHGKMGIKNPHQYLVEGLKLYSMKPWARRAHNHFFNKLHYEIIQTKHNGLEVTDELRNEVDYKGGLYNLGVRPPWNQSVSYYEQGINKYTAGKTKEAVVHLKNSLAHGLTGFAKTIALFILVLCDLKSLCWRPDPQKMKEIFLQAPIQQDEIQRFTSTPVSIFKSRRRLRRWLKNEILDKTGLSFSGKLD